MRRTRHRTISCLLLAGLTLGGQAAALWADEASQALARQGAAELGRSRFAEALALLEKAIAADPQDGDARFLAGLALNRLGRHREALATLREAEKLKTQYRDLHFELGWALLFQGENRQAIAALSHYESLKPGRGLTQELLGRAHLALGEDAKAEAALREALRRDPRLAPTCSYYLGAIALRRGEARKGAELLEDLAQRQPDTAAGRSARDLLERRRAADRRWSFAATFAAGYDDNAVQAGRNEPLPPGLDRRRAALASTTLEAGYDLLRTPDHALRAELAFASTAYRDVAAFNATDYWARLRYWRRLADRFAANAVIEGHYGELGGDPYSRDLAFAPSLDISLAPWAVLRASYAVARSDNRLSVGPVLDRDGTAHTVGLTQFLRLSPALTARLGYFHTWSRTDGRDYDMDSDSLVAGLAWQLPGRAALDLSYARAFENYAHRNSFTGFTRRRDTDLDLVRLHLTKELTDHWSIWTTLDWVSSDSNIALYDFNRTAWALGFTFRY